MADAGDLKSPEACNLVWVRLPPGPFPTRPKEGLSPFLGFQRIDRAVSYLEALNCRGNQRLLCFGLGVLDEVYRGGEAVYELHIHRGCGELQLS